MSTLFKSFDRPLGVETRQGWELTDLGSNILEFAQTSAYRDEPDTVTFLHGVKNFDADTDWDLDTVRLLKEGISTGHIPLIRTFEPGDPNLPKYRYDLIKDKVGAAFKVSRAARDAFKARCERDGVSQASVIEAFLIEYANRQ